MTKKSLFLIIILNFVFLGIFAQNTWYVSETGNDSSGDGTQALPWATITKALSENTTVNGDTILVSGTITQSGLTAGGIDILKNVIIKGESKESSIVQASENSSSATSRVFTNWSIVKIMNLTIKNGYFDSFSPQYGAGILNWGFLTLENCIITDNNIENTELGGGIYNEFGILNLTDTYVVSNFSAYGGAGIVTEGGSLNIENSTIALNYTQQNLAMGAGILITDTADVNIQNSTIYYNLTGLNSYGAGICIKGDDSHTGTIRLNLLNVTIADNETGNGSLGNGIYVQNNSSNPAELAIKNCIISNSESDNYGEEGNNITVLRTHTLCSDATLTGGGSNGNLDNLNPEIESFENHGGNTPTASLLQTSPAINMGNDEGAPITDQRGYARDGITDMGAFEFQTNTGIKNIKESSFSIYPNPANKVVTLNIPTASNSENFKIEIIDINGKVIYKNYNSSNFPEQIDFSQYNSGIYIIKANINGNIYTKKIIIK